MGNRSSERLTMHVGHTRGRGAGYDPLETGRLPWERMSGDLASGGIDPFDPRETDPPSPVQVLTRIALMLVITLGFGLAAELLVRLPVH